MDKRDMCPPLTADAVRSGKQGSASHPVAIEQRVKDAQLVRDMLEMPQWKDQAWARMALTVALRAIERGRHWTPSERLDNLMEALMEDAREDSE